MKTIEDCANCKDKEVGRNKFDELCKLINEIGKKYDLDKNLFKMNARLNKEEALCEGCKRQEIRKLADRCENEEIAKFLHECNANHHNYIRWIPFDEFKNIEYLAKGGFGEIHKAIWINGFKNNHHDKVVLKRIHNSSNKTVDILKEVKVYY